MIKKKLKPMKAITPAQKVKLKQHKKHHTKKHMDMMTKHMKQGKTFTQAHNKAQKVVGK
tara:strand:+ start:657 stop:833 length:177 start_codon:yes stop_codon:yes gene_type:complete